MRFVLFLATAFLLAAPAATADQRDPRLGPLFNQLAKVRTAQEAGFLSLQIVGLWQASGSDTVDLLMGRAAAAVEAQDYDTGMKLLNAIVDMKPDYAEVFYRRAELFLRIDSQQQAATDLAAAVKLEPRDFRAHALVGRLADEAGNAAAALAAYRQALSINPMLDGVRKRATELSILEGKKSTL